jgi:hypothetical protein
MRAEAQGARENRKFDASKETSLREFEMLQQIGMGTKYGMIPGGSSIAGTNLPIRQGVELYDWANGQHVMQKGNEWMNSTTRGTAALQNNNTQIVADQRIEAPNTYQNDVNAAFGTQASETTGAINSGSSIAARSSREGAAIQLSGINRAAVIERSVNQLNFEGRTEAASINQAAAFDAAHLRMVSTVVSGFFRNMDRRLEEIKPKY